MSRSSVTLPRLSRDCKDSRSKYIVFYQPEQTLLCRCPERWSSTSHIKASSPGIGGLGLGGQSVLFSESCGGQKVLPSPGPSQPGRSPGLLSVLHSRGTNMLPFSKETPGIFGNSNRSEKASTWLLSGPWFMSCRPVLHLCDLESVEDTRATSVFPSAKEGSDTEQRGDGEGE